MTTKRTLTDRKRPRTPALATLDTVQGLDDKSGPRHDLRTRRRTGRDQALNTIVTPELHQALRMASVRLKKPIGLLIEEAWALHPESKKN